MQPTSENLFEIQRQQGLLIFRILFKIVIEAIGQTGDTVKRQRYNLKNFHFSGINSS